jgi:hypothetical protein
VNYEEREINFKIVYFGCGLAGKTTSWQYVYEVTSEERKSEITRLLSEETGFIKFFNFLPLELGRIKGFSIRLHLYVNAPSEVYHPPSQQIILRGVDAIVFVADSYKERSEANIYSLFTLKQNLDNLGYNFDSLPHVFQLNKRDIPNAMEIQDLVNSLSCEQDNFVETVAYKGIGVFQPLKILVKRIVTNLKQ